MNKKELAEQIRIRGKETEKIEKLMKSLVELTKENKNKTGEVIKSERTYTRYISRW